MNTIIALLLAVAPAHAVSRTGERNVVPRTTTGPAVDRSGSIRLPNSAITGHVLGEVRPILTPGDPQDVREVREVQNVEARSAPANAVSVVQLQQSQQTGQEFGKMPGQAKELAVRAVNPEAGGQVFDKEGQRSSSVADTAVVQGSAGSNVVSLARYKASKAAKAVLPAVALGYAASMFTSEAAQAATTSASFLPTSLSIIYGVLQPYLLTMLVAAPILGLIWSSIRLGNAVDPVNKTRHWLRTSGSWHGMSAGLIAGGLLGTLLASTGVIASSTVVPFLIGGYVLGHIAGRDKFFIGGPRRLRVLSTMKWAKWGGFWAGGIGLAVVGLKYGGLKALFAAGAGTPLLIAAAVGLAGMAVAAAIGYRYSLNPNGTSAGAAVADSAIDPWTAYAFMDLLGFLVRAAFYLLAAVLG